MLRQIRQSVFETNSSSTHAVAILTEEEFEAWKRGDTVVSRYGQFTPKEELKKLQDKAREKIKAGVTKDWNDPNSYEYEYFHKRFATLEDCIKYQIEDAYEDDLFDYDQDYISTETASRTVNGVKVYAVSVEGSEC